MQVWTKLLAVAALVFGLCLTMGPARAETFFEQLIMPGELAEAHAKLETTCENCHASFDQATQPGLCLDCHKPVKADVEAKTGFHGRSPDVAARACSACHNDHQGRDFNMVGLDADTFDHAQTDFALTEAHATADCEGCHLPGKKMAAAPSACVDCHKVVEPHKGALGTDCARCHGATRWNDVKSFDHSKTKFALIGNHAKLDCAACHAGEVWKGLPVDCVGCHKIDDVHANRFGTGCGDCHDSVKWVQVKFDHNRDSKFALTGAHKDTKCESCHLPGDDPKKTTQACIGCHKADDAHKASLGEDCAACHGTQSWLQDVAFDHDLTRLPLLGQHAVVPCEGCHATTEFGTVEPACGSCHGPDDIHKASLGADCVSCHTPNGWAFWQFDHDSQTDFDLTGKHKGLACDACHAPNTDPAVVKTVCATCHQKQDVHKGTFGTTCDACHTTTTFKGAKLQVPAAP